MVRRSDNLKFYPGLWNSIGGFLDDHKSLEEKVKAEIREELSLAPSQVKKIQVGEIFDFDQPKYRKTWVIHPVLVELSSDKIRLDWEAQDYRWVKVKELKKLKLVPGFDAVLKKLFHWL